MRILYLHQFFATRNSSHPTRSYEFARRMVADGHDVIMVTGSSRLEAECPGDPLLCRIDVDGIDVRVVRNRYSNYMGHTRRILSFLTFTLTSIVAAMRTPRPDVVFATSTPLTIGIPGVVVSKLRRVPLVFEVRDPWPEAAIQMGALQRGSLAAGVAKWLERTIYRSSRMVIGLSPGMIDCVLAEGVPEDKTRMIPNCSDLELFHPGPKNEDLLGRYGLTGRFVVTYAGAIGPSNDIGNVLRAAELLAGRGRDDIRILLVGDGKDRPRLTEERDRLGLTNVVITGSISKAELPDLIRSSDVILVHLADVPILATGSPNKLFDGISSGRPVIVNSPGWTRPLVEDNGVGLYVPPADPIALAEAIEALADDPARVEEMGRAARRLAESDFDRDAHARRLIEVLEEAARAKRA